MTHETLRKARENATKAGASNAEFRLGEIEHLPIAGWAAGRGIENYVASATIEACKPNPAARLD